MEKLKVTREQALVLFKLIKEEGFTFGELICRVHNGLYTNSSKIKGIESLSAEDIGKAYLNGWEIVKSKEDKLSDVYNDLKEASTESTSAGYRLKSTILTEGIDMALDILEIKIEGIN